MTVGWNAVREDQICAYFAFDKQVLIGSAVTNPPMKPRKFWPGCKIRRLSTKQIGMVLAEATIIEDGYLVLFDGEHTVREVPTNDLELYTAGMSAT